MLSVIKLPGAYFSGGGRHWAMPPFWSKDYENSQQSHVFNIFVILGVSWLRLVANPELTLLQLHNTYFQISLVQFVHEFNQKWSLTGIIFAKKKQQSAHSLWALPPDPCLPLAARDFTPRPPLVIHNLAQNTIFDHSFWRHCCLPFKFPAYATASFIFRIHMLTFRKLCTT